MKNLASIFLTFFFLGSLMIAPLLIAASDYIKAYKKSAQPIASATVQIENTRQK